MVPAVMQSLLSVALFLLPATLLHALSIQTEQQILRPESLYALLRRFEIGRNSSDIDTEHLLRVAEDYHLDVWQITPSHVDIYFPPSSPALPDSLVDHAHSVVPISVPSYQNATGQITPAQIAEWNLSNLENTTYHLAYHPLYEIEAFIHEIADLYPETVEVIALGHSGEGREMYGLKLSRQGSKKGKDETANRRKMGFVITGAQHAREWVATSTSLYIIHALVANSSSHSMSHLLDEYDFYVVPVPNPDGYRYTWETDRLWYKNRMVLGPYETCIGLDMNRNWGYKWRSKTKSAAATTAPSDPCHHWFPGHRPFEAPEVNNMANFVITLPNLKAFVDLRSYGQMISSPYSYSCKKKPGDAEDLLEAALGVAQTVKKSHGTLYTTGGLCSTLYRAPGNIIDWMYKKANVKYSYAVHLRDTGTYGFSLPPEWIRPVGEETANMIEYLADFIVSRRD